MDPIPTPLEDHLYSFGIPAERRTTVASLLARYAEDLHQENSRFGLISKDDATSVERILERHIVDALRAFAILQSLVRTYKIRTLYDLGSGAGLPGIPLAVALEGLEAAYLVERRGKRVSFLLGEVARLRALDPDLPVIRPLEADANSLREQPYVDLRSALVVFRAYRQTDEASLRDLASQFPEGTPVAAYKGRIEASETELLFLEASPYAVDPQLHVLQDGQQQRTLLVWTSPGAQKS